MSGQLHVFRYGSSRSYELPVICFEEIAMKFHRDQVLSGSLNLHIRKLNDSYFIAEIDPEAMAGAGNRTKGDQGGEVLYVVAVVFLWGFSIVLMIASYVRKNRMDNNVSLYLKEIQTVQRRTRKEKILRLISLLQSGAGGTSSGRGDSTATSGLKAAPMLPGIHRVSSNSSGLSCSSPSPSPVLDQREPMRCHHQQTVELWPPSRPEASQLAVSADPKVKRHSYGCFLPEICIESDVDLTTEAVDQSSVSDFGEAKELLEDQRQVETTGRDGRHEQLITEL